MTVFSDEVALKKLARLRLMASREKKPFKLMRFIEDAEYAKSTITELLESEDEDLLVLAMDVMGIFGLTSRPEMAKEQQNKAPQLGKQYLGGARGG